MTLIQFRMYVMHDHPFPSTYYQSRPCSRPSGLIVERDDLLGHLAIKAIDNKICRAAAVSKDVPDLLIPFWL